jgi:hypothetical protein
VQRAYRLEPRQMTETQLRVDQGTLAASLDADLGSSQTVGFSALMAPRIITGTQFSMGLAGQMVSPGDFDRKGIGPAANDPDALIAELSSSAGVRRLVRIRAAGVLLNKKDNEALRRAVDAFASSNDVLMAAAAAHEVTSKAFLTDPRPLVRLMAVARIARSLTGGEEAEKLARDELQHAQSMETDETVKSFIATALEGAPVVVAPTPASPATSAAAATGRSATSPSTAAPATGKP